MGFVFLWYHPFMRFSGKHSHRIFASTKTTTKRAYENAKHLSKDFGPHKRPTQIYKLCPNGGQQQRSPSLTGAKNNRRKFIGSCRDSGKRCRGRFFTNASFPKEQTLSLENKILLSNPTKPNYPNVKDAGKRAGAK